LLPSAPGVITHLIYGAFLLATSVYTVSVWRNFGFKFLANPKMVLPLGGLIVANSVFQ